jgi:hypothetical protein
VVAGGAAHIVNAARNDICRFKSYQIVLTKSESMIVWSRVIRMTSSA